MHFLQPRGGAVVEPARSSALKSFIIWSYPHHYTQRIIIKLGQAPTDPEILYAYLMKDASHLTARWVT